MNKAALTAIESFEGYVASRRAAVEACLERFLPCPPICPEGVAGAMRYGVMGGGKRMRPLLTLAAAETVAVAQRPWDDRAIDDAQRLAMPAACAIEFVHCYSLIHDDLPAMDNACMRRGRPTVHVLYGDAIAILAGDGLLAEALAILASEPDDRGLPQLADRKLRVMKRIGAALGAGGMLGGQAMDLALAQRDAPTAVDAAVLRDMHARKTGSLIRAAAVSGAIMAGGTAEHIGAVDRFAAELGLAFQITDDILDVAGDEQLLGKSVGADSAQHKCTYPAMFGLDRSRQMAAQCSERAQQALRSAGLDGERLAPIAQWAISRCN